MSSEEYVSFGHIDTETLNLPSNFSLPTKFKLEIEPKQGWTDFKRFDLIYNFTGFDLIEDGQSLAYYKKEPLIN